MSFSSSVLRRALSLTLITAAGGIAFASLLPREAVSSARSSEQDAALSKIAPWVTSHTANGAEAEFLIVLSQQADLSGADELATKEEKGRYVRDVLWKTAQETQGALLADLRANKIEHRPYYIVNMVWAKGTLQTALRLASRPDVARIEGNPVIQNFVDPLPFTQIEESAPQPGAPAAIEPGVTYIRAPEVWATGVRGEGIVIAGADTGYRWTHNALKGKYRGWNGTTASHDFNWHDSIHAPATGGSCGPDKLEPCDDNGHGTHTMGTMVGDDGIVNQTGVAPGAKWIACRNMDAGNGTPATYTECMEFFLAPYPINGTPAQGDPSKAPHITSNSWSCPAAEGCAAGTLRQAVDAQRAAGIQMIVAAGNSGSACSTVSDPPALYESAYTVGALSTGTDNIASFSSRGPVTVDASLRRKPDIAAPGTSTRSSYRTSDTSYASLSGTSMATPHVAGAAALLLSARPALRDVMLTRTALNQSAVHLNSNTCDVGQPSTWPNNVFGYGRIDIKNAVDNVIQITGAVSRKSHNGIAPFDVQLPLSGPSGVECRTSGGNHTIVLTFSKPITTGSAVASGSGSVSGAPVISGNTMTIQLTGVTDVQTLLLNLSNVTDGGNGFMPNSALPVRFLAGDVNGDGTVNAADITITRSRSGQTADATNFRSDLNVDGSVNAADATIVRSRSGQSVP